MASKYYLETRDERIERMMRDNPGRPAELCTAVVDGIWEDDRDAIEERIPERFKQASLGDLGHMEQTIVDSVQELLDSPDKNDTVGLIFTGTTGSGKTHTAYAIIRALMSRNPEIIGHITSYGEMFNALKHEFVTNAYNESGSVWELLTDNDSMNQGLVLIDDLSSQKLTDFEMDKLLTIFDKRINSYMPFIVTTNVSIADFQKVFGDRISSRLLGNCKVIQFGEQDVRLEKKTGDESKTI